ncbi:MAG: cellulase family glycosylhydrolase, partial [Gammaproteobacteria bacterium]
MGATTIGISGDKFTINGKEAFLLGVSYFDAFNWHASDLDELKARGYNLIRVWLDWEDRGLFDADGNLTWEQPLAELVEASDARGLVVDVTMLDGSLSFGPSNREKAVRQAVSALKGKPNVIFNIMNAHDSGEHALSHTQVKTLIEAVVEEDPDAIITVSSSPGHIIRGKTLQKTRVDEELSAGITVFTPHLPRTSDWYSRTEERVTRIKNHFKDTARMVPVYLQEEARRGLAKLNPTQDEFLHAAKAALSAGAAAWIFHTAAGFDLAGGSLFSQLNAVEKSTIDALPKAIFGSDTNLTATTSMASDTSTKSTLSEDLASAPQQQPNSSEQSPSVSAATLSARASGATYYVDTNHPSASDSNPGTEVLPWKTIQKPANMLVAGDTVYI